LKISKVPNSHFPKEDIQMDNRYFKNCSISLIIRKMQVKTTVRFHFTQLIMAIIQKGNKTNQKVEKASK
jgi:hypothetical protein